MWRSQSKHNAEKLERAEKYLQEICKETPKIFDLIQAARYGRMEIIILGDIEQLRHNRETLINYSSCMYGKILCACIDGLDEKLAMAAHEIEKELEKRGDYTYAQERGYLLTETRERDPDLADKLFYEQRM
ncbi:MAG: hypothetical protein U9O95_02570 [Candidatus Marinimicrobia bacterium]|nr:hypothetical protein [Candidatus Neomarinimicrobiota bacterium]